MTQNFSPSRTNLHLLY